MTQRYTCMICRNEIAHLGAECPYCKGRSAIAEGASPRMLAFVFTMMVAVFVFAGFYTRSFKAEGKDRGRLHFQAAEVEMSQERYDQAVERYRDALLYSRDDPAYRLGLARALYAAGRYSETEVYLLGLRAGDPTSGVINHLLARVAARDERTDQAVSYYQTALNGEWREDPDETRLLLLLELVDLLERSGRTEHMRTTVLELASLRPDDPEVSHRLARLLLGIEIYDLAASIYASLLDSDASDRMAHLGRAEAEFHLGNYLTARKHYEAAQREAEDEATDSRIRLCDQIIELDPTGRGIDLSARFTRSRLLVERAMAALLACQGSFSGPLAPVPEEEAGVLARAEQLLDARRARASDTAVESNILLAEEIWKLAVQRCHTSDPPDQPLRHVLAKLAR